MDLRAFDLWRRRDMVYSRFKTWCTAALLAAGGVAVPLGLLSRATLANPGAQSPEGESQEVIRGAIESFHKNDHDDVDGLVLKRGVTVRFPPHMGKAVTELAAIGDEVQIRVERVTRPRGEVVLEVRRIEHDGKAVVVEGPPRGPKGKAGPKGEPGHDARMKVEGVVAELLTNPKGDVDGLKLDDKTEVKFPPHLGAELKAMAKPGEKVLVAGRRHVTPKGDVHLHADRIEIASTGAVIERRPPEHAGPPPRPKGDHHGPAADDVSRTQKEILQELREIRRLLDKKSS
jgi:hypothetical protein